MKNKLAGKIRRLILPAAILAALAFGFYLPYLLTGRPLFSTNLFQFLPWKNLAAPQDLRWPVNSMMSDPLVYFLPVYAYVQKCIHNLVLPMWNPYLLCGYPFIADGTTGFFHPLNWIFVGLSPLQMLAFSAMLRIFLAGLFMFLYLKYMEVGKAAALFGGICFMFNGFFITWNKWMVDSAIWLPLMFLMIEKAVREKQWKYFLLLSFVTSMSILAGMFQIALYNIYAAGLYAAWRGINERKHLRSVAFLYSGFSASVLIALLLSAVQVVPFYEYISNTYRRSVDLETEFFPNVCPPEFLVQYVMPEFFGSHTEEDFWLLGMAQHMNKDLENNPGWSSNLAELNGYTGVIVFLLALLGFSARRKSFSWFFFILILLSRLPIFSKTALSAYYYVIPGFQTSWAGRLSFVYMFALITLAAFGLDRFFSSAEDETFRNKLARMLKLCGYAGALSIVFLAVTAYFRSFDTSSLSNALASDGNLPARLQGYYIAILAAGYFWPHTLHTFAVCMGTLILFGGSIFLFRRRALPAPALAFALTLVAAAELFHFHYRFNPIQKPDPYVETGSIHFLQHNLGAYRIARFGNKGVLPFNTSLFYGLRDSQGYIPLILRPVSDLLRALDEDSILHDRWAIPFKKPRALKSQVLDLLSVKYVLTDLNTNLESDHFQRVYEDGIRIYENRDVMPRAFYVPGYEVVPSRDELLRKLSDPAVNLRQTVLLEEDPRMDLPDPPPAASAGTAHIIRDDPNDVEIAVDAPADGFLVLADTHFPGWQVRVDGEETKIYRANYLFRAVRVPAGAHTIRFQFRPPSLYAGALISGITLLCVLALLLVPLVTGRLRRKEAREHVASAGALTDCGCGATAGQTGGHHVEEKDAL